MNAYELADHLAECIDNGSTDLVCVEEAAEMLRQQADKIEVYEQVLQAIANDYHELSDHKIEVQVRNHKKWAREALSLSGNNAQSISADDKTLPDGK